MVLGTCGWIQAQTNSWNSNTGGNWDTAASWSLGVPPASTQSIMFTNAFWKAVVIDSSTVASAPQTLAVNSLTITSVSPTNGAFTTRNTLLLNYAGAGNPLVIGVDASTPGSLIIGDTNSALVMLSSGLIVNDALGTNNSHLGEFEVDGTLSQSDNSEVVAGFLNLTGTYNFTNGELFVGTEFINGTFNQQGGTNTGSLIFTENGEYNLFDGVLQGGVALNNPFAGIFNQSGGTNIGSLGLDGPGVYQLSGGLLVPGDLQVGPSELLPSSLGAGAVVQTGGTDNAGNITMGGGSYSLQGGVLTASNLTLPPFSSRIGFSGSSFNQSGGFFSSGSVVINGGHDVNSGLQPSFYMLNGGILQSPSITMNLGNFFQYLGTNGVGTLSASNNSSYTINGGMLAVDLIQLNDATFLDNGGTLAGNRNLTLANGFSWYESHAAAGFGQLRISGGTNYLYLMSSPCVIRFADSSAVPWTGGGRLMIMGWTGSLSGGGSQQVLFGSNASGLTAQQLSQVQFWNPASLPSGIYGAKILSNGEVIPDQSSSSAGPVNSWINPVSGNWDEASSWSLGMLPNSSQSVVIANTNWKAVAINPSTPVNFPASMTISNLFIDGATNTENTLLLNNFGTAVPLTILNALSLRDGAQILNFNASLIVDGITFSVTNSDIIQDGGFMLTTNGMTLNDSTFAISNGVFVAGFVGIGYPRSAHFSEYGGSVTISNIALASYIPGAIPNGISLYGGTLDLPNGMPLYGEPGGVSYFQAGGTNITGQISLGADMGQGAPIFTLNGGLLADTGLSAMGGDIGSISVNQNGGTHIITNSLSLEGENHLGEFAVVASYNLNGGTLSAGAVNLNADSGTAAFNQTNGTAYVGEFQGVSEPYESYWSPALNLSGGTLACSNLDMLDSGTITQTGGTLVVSNTLTVAGFIAPGPKIYSTYQFTNGTLVASNINIGGNWIIGDSAGTNRITNAGTCTLSNSLAIGNAVEQLGRFILGDTATINLAGSASRLSFANSSGQSWTSGAMLVVLDWNGNQSGGGAEQLKFGVDQSGLTAAQLNQIRFRISTNLYSAKILNTGEVVPDQQVAPSLKFAQQGNQLILNWLPGYKLQTATDPAGPYQDVFMPFTTSPYTNSINQPEQFFRIVPQ